MTKAIVLFHRGDDIPHLEAVLKQIRIFNPDIPVHMICDPDFYRDHRNLFTKYNVYNYFCQNLDTYEKLIVLKSGHEDKSLWNTSIQRVFALKEFINANPEISTIYHFDNDVMVYSDLSNLCCPKSAVTVGTSQHVIFGFSIFHNTHEYYAFNPEKRGKILNVMCDYILEALGDPAYQTRHGFDMINEMVILSQFMKEYPHALRTLDSIPSITNCGCYSSDSFSETFTPIFDPAAYGQNYLGTRTEGPGWAEHKHYVGSAILKKEIALRWTTDIENRRIPVVVDKEGGVFKLNTLHIHSKRCSEALSNVL